jgi:FdhE protein
MDGGFPLLNRWDFPLDSHAASQLFARIAAFIPEDNLSMRAAHAALANALKGHPAEAPDIWASFLQHELDPWEEWISTERIDVPSLLFLARAVIRPSIEWTAEDLTSRFPVPAEWLRGHCPVCGSLPSLLTLRGEGERRAHCSWCGTEWGLHRLQCPHCDNRAHESLGYLYAEDDPSYRVQYCRLCKAYFKLLDTRENLDPPCVPLEEWTTLHLDLIAQREGWKTPPSPAPAVYESAGDQTGH